VKRFRVRMRRHEQNRVAWRHPIEHVDGLGSCQSSYETNTVRTSHAMAAVQPGATVPPARRHPKAGEAHRQLDGASRVHHTFAWPEIESRSSRRAGQHRRRTAPARSPRSAVGCHGKVLSARLGAIVVTLVAAMIPIPALMYSGTARADESQYEAFYTPPDPLPPGAPGDLIRTEPSRLVLEPSGQLGSFVGTGTRIMYRSTDAQGNPVAVTGTYIEPDNPWPGKGPRPLLAYATIPYGMGEQCAPSRLFNQGIHASLQTGFDLAINTEEGFIATLLARGFAIVVTDGVGMGVHGSMSPQFLNRRAGGAALIDAAKAAMQLPGTTLDPHGPVAFWGWLAGGTAAMAAAEMVDTYGPELNVVGTYAAAAPTDLAPLLAPIDGNFLAGSTGYLLRGIIASYPQTEQPVRDSLTPRGLEMLDNTGRQCLFQTAVDYMFRHLDFWFKGDIAETARTDPFKSILAAQRIGNVKPRGPVYLTYNRWDPFSPYASARQTAADWCRMGADVTFWTNEEPPLFNKLDVNSLLPTFVDGERSMDWVTDRFNGVPTKPNCADITTEVSTDGQPSTAPDVGAN
jgi:Secretory lipase